MKIINLIILLKILTEMILSMHKYNEKYLNKMNNL